MFRKNSHTSTIVVCLVRSGPPGFWSVFVSWELNRTGIKALNLSKKEWGWSHSSGVYVYISHIFSQTESLWKGCRIFFFPSPKNNSWKKHLTAGQWIVNRSERLTWRCGKTHASRQQRFCRPSHASDGFSQKPASQKPFGCKNMSKKVTTHP